MKLLARLSRYGYFTEQDIDAAYRYQERFGQRLRNPVKPAGCYLVRKEFEALLEGKHFLAPCRFLTQIVRHLKQILEDGAARYLFPLDADHAHLPFQETYGAPSTASYR